VLCALALGKDARGAAAIFWRQTKNLRARLGLAAYHPQTVFSLDTVYGPLYFRDNFGDITNLVDLFYRPVYRVREIAGEGVILDVGANIGLAAAWFRFHNPGRPIYCFEPLESNTELIRLNCPSAHIERIALGRTRGRASLQVDVDGVMASRIPCNWGTRETAFDVVPLDEIVSDLGIERVAVLKIDAEGMEGEILDGAVDTLRRTRQVTMETHGRDLHEQVIGLLREAGFRIEAESFDAGTGLVFASRDEIGLADQEPRAAVGHGE